MYRGDYPVGATVRFGFSTSLASGARGAFSDALEAGDIRVYKDGGTTERSSTAGFTVSSAFDSLVGVHAVALDTSDNTDSGFYAAGHDYMVVLYPDTETVDSLNVGAVVAEFSIENRSTTPAVNAFFADARSGLKRGNTAQGGTAGTVGGTPGTIQFDASASAVDDFYKGDFVIANIDTIVDGMYVASYNGTTKTATMEDGWKGGVAPDSNDPFYIFAASGTVASLFVSSLFAHTMGAPLGSLTYEQVITKQFAVILGNHAGFSAGAGTVTFKSADGVNQVSFVVDADGNIASLNLAP